MKGYMDTHSNKYFKRMYEEFLNKYLKKYCGKDKFICSLGSYDDSLVDKIDFFVLHLVDKNFGELKHLGEKIPVLCFEKDIEDFIMNCVSKYDVIIMSNVLEHLEINTVKIILDNINRMLVDGGVFIITYPNGLSINRFVGTVLGMLEYPFQLGSHDIKYGHKRMYSTTFLKRIENTTSLKLVEEIGIMFKPLALSQMDEYFPDKIDTFLEIGYKLGPEVCSLIGGVFRK